MRPLIITDSSLLPRDGLDGRDGAKGEPGESIIGPSGKDAEPIVPMAEWKYQTQYPRLALVYWENDSYLAREPNKNQEPSENSRVWQLIARSIKGRDGEDSRGTHIRSIVRTEATAQLVKANFLEIARPGQALYVVNEQGEVAKAKADNLLTARVIGLKAADGSDSFQADGIFHAGNWQQITNSMHLIPASYYYLSNTNAGQLTATPPTTGFLVQVGQAVSRSKLALSLDNRVIEL